VESDEGLRRLSTDVNNLSTSDLVLCWTLLSQQLEYARQQGSTSAVREFSKRRRFVELALAERQLKLTDELQGAD
jgi:hypothetical protein